MGGRRRERNRRRGRKTRAMGGGERKRAKERRKGREPMREKEQDLLYY